MSELTTLIDLHLAKAVVDREEEHVARNLTIYSAQAETGLPYLDTSDWQFERQQYAFE